MELLSLITNSEALASRMSLVQSSCTNCLIVHNDNQKQSHLPIGDETFSVRGTQRGLRTNLNRVNRTTVKHSKLN